MHFELEPNCPPIHAMKIVIQNYIRNKTGRHINIVLNEDATNRELTIFVHCYFVAAQFDIQFNPF